MWIKLKPGNGNSREILGVNIFNIVEQLRRYSHTRNNKAGNIEREIDLFFKMEGKRKNSLRMKSVSLYEHNVLRKRVFNGMYGSYSEKKADAGVVS